MIATPTGDSVRGWNGVEIQPNCAIADAGLVDAVYIAPLGEVDDEPPRPDDATLEWIAACYRDGAMITSACSGTYVIAEAGILSGERATTHWAWADIYKRIYPDIAWQARRALVFSGDGHRIVTAGGGSLWTDLILYLTARLVSQEAAVQLSKLYLIDWSREDQLPYLCLETSRQHHDRQIRDAQAWIAEHLTEGNILEQARRHAGLGKRTFERRFKAATDLAPVKYVQQMRVEKAKNILETGDTPVDAVAAQIGYTDPSSFRRLFRRLVGVTPGTYRKQFGCKWS